MQGRDSEQARISEGSRVGIFPGFPREGQVAQQNLTVTKKNLIFYLKGHGEGWGPVSDLTKIHTLPSYQGALSIREDLSSMGKE